MVYIYILKLFNDKYYVGKTVHPEFRLKTHFTSYGSAWTKKYKPIKLVELVSDCDDFDEDKYTLKYMDKFGITNVRGGSFSQCNLPQELIKTIERMITGTNDCCHFCGKTGHFIGNCRYKKDSDKMSKLNTHYLQLSMNYESADEIAWDDNSSDDDDNLECLYCSKVFDTKKAVMFHEYRFCNKKNTSCKAVWSCSYCDKTFKTKKGAQFHENVYCKVKKQLKNDTLSSAKMRKWAAGVYKVDGEELYWDGGEWYEESTNDAGHRDGTFGNQYGDWRPIKKQKKSTRNGGCHKCGRKGHYASKCYAKRHIKGYNL